MCIWLVYYRHNYYTKKKGMENFKVTRIIIIILLLLLLLFKLALISTVVSLSVSLLHHCYFHNPTTDTITARLLLQLYVIIVTL